MSSPAADRAKKTNEASQASIVQVRAVTHVVPLSPSPNVPRAPNLGPSTNSLMEREQGLVDALLLRFKNIVELAAAPKDDVTAEVAAAQAFQTNVETQALVCFPLFFPCTMLLWICDDRLMMLDSRCGGSAQSHAGAEGAVALWSLERAGRGRGGGLD